MSVNSLTCGMHLPGLSSDATYDVGVKLKGAADAVLGTGPASASSAYDVRSGALLTFILLFVVGWIPILGQMIAGYVGGRKAGSPARGLVATGVATFGVVVILVLISVILSNINSGLASDPEVQISEISATSPMMGQLLTTTLGYVQGIFGGTTAFTINFWVYAMAVVFGLIGGIIADQSRKETRLIIASAGNAPVRHMRSLDLYKVGKKMGFESFDEYASLSVNTMSTNQRSSIIVKEVLPKSSIVTETVDIAPKVGITATSSSNDEDNPFANILAKTSHRVASSDEKIESSDDLEFI